MEKVARDVAELEIESWLDHKKVKSKKRESNADQLERLVEAVQDGVLKFDEANGHLVQILNFPIGDNDQIKELSYKPRLKVGESHRFLKGYASDDMDGRMLAYVCAITNQPKNILTGLDTDDYGVANSIVVFFL